MLLSVRVAQFYCSCRSHFSRIHSHFIRIRSHSFALHSHAFACIRMHSHFIHYIRTTFTSFGRNSVAIHVFSGINVKKYINDSKLDMTGKWALRLGLLIEFIGTALAAWSYMEPFACRWGTWGLTVTLFFVVCTQRVGLLVVPRAHQHQLLVSR